MSSLLENLADGWKAINPVNLWDSSLTSTFVDEEKKGFTWLEKKQHPHACLNSSKEDEHSIRIQVNSSQKGRFKVIRMKYANEISCSKERMSYLKHWEELGFEEDLRNLRADLNAIGRDMYSAIDKQELSRDRD